MSNFSAAEIFSTFKRGGLWVGAISLATTIILGVLDQFTSRVIPFFAESIENFIAPPKFYISFLPTVDTSGQLRVSVLTSDAATPVRVRRIEANVFAAGPAGPGNYLLRLRGTGSRAGQELVSTMKIVKSGDEWKVDNDDRYWGSAAELAGGIRETTSSPVGLASETNRLSGTRWTAADADFALVAKTDGAVSRSILANALAEVGIFENGSDREKGRIVSYWAAAGQEWAGKMTISNLQTQPWGGAFLAWVVRQANVEPPMGSASFFKWEAWGEQVSPEAMSPGMVAIFRLGDSREVPEAVSRRLVGIVVRRQSKCIDIVAGNVADRVVITCVKTNLLSTVRRPRY